VRGTPKAPQSWNMYVYAQGNPVRFTDPRGTIINGQDGKDVGAPDDTPEKTKVVEQPAAPQESPTSTSSGSSTRIPSEGRPNTTDTFPNRSGGRTERNFGPDGRAKTDVDHGHDHGAGDPHGHDWDWTKDTPRQPSRPLTPEETAKAGKQASNAAKVVAVGVVIYWVVSEGSRIFFPPRNLVPIP